jgi:hypothetical protein
MELRQEHNCESENTKLLTSVDGQFVDVVSLYLVRMENWETSCGRLLIFCVLLVPLVRTYDPTAD